MKVPNIKDQISYSAAEWFGKFLTADLVSTAKSYIADPQRFTRTFVVTVNGKHRNILTYQANADGAALRKVHYYYSEFIKRQYTKSPCSYAYTKGRGIMDCVNQHLDGQVFLKTDIHKFFESVDYRRMIQKILEFPVCQDYSTIIVPLTRACFHEGHLPIGFISSPVLSDLFLTDLDRKFQSQNLFIYTRYADDLIFSASVGYAAQIFPNVQSDLALELGKLGLELNTKKTYIRTLNQEGDAIHVLGVNIVKTRSPRNRVTISGRYLRKISKDLYDLMAGRQKGSMQDAFTEVYGRIAFVNLCSQDSMQKLRKMFYVKSGYRGPFTRKALWNACQ